MYDITKLTEDEIRYICERMDFMQVKQYFQRYPKEFNKIKPGFTVKKMTDDSLVNILVNYSDKPFIHQLITNVVTMWISQIEDNCEQLEKTGFTSGEALLKSIPDCIFCDRIELYFKLIEKTNSADYMNLVCDALSLIKKSSDDVMEKHHNELQNNEIERLNSEIHSIIMQLDEKNEHENALKMELDNANEQLQKNQNLLHDANTALHSAESTISDMKQELEHYHRLNKYAQDEISQPIVSNYQYVSVGQVQHDYNNQRWIIRLADITESGSIVPFIADETIPHYFSNRDRLYWRNGPDTEKAIGVWNWNVSPRDTDPDKDYVETDFCNNIQLIQVISLSNCESLDDIVDLMKNGLSLKFVCNKLLFVYEDKSALIGLLCSPDDFNRNNILKSSIYTLPQYIIKKSDTIELAGIKIYKYLSLGIPQSIFKVRDPYEAVKSLVISRVTNANLHEYELTKKEVQRCRIFLDAIPTQTITDELTHAYNCSKETAQEYIDGFISLADTYLSSSDLDTTIISRAIQGNTDLQLLCKQQLTDEWETENKKRLTEAELTLNNVLSIIKTKQNEIIQLENDKNKLYTEMEQLKNTLSQREQLAADVESKISMQIEKAKQNVADFISNMAFVSPLSSPVISNPKQLSNKISIFNSHIDCIASGVIDDIDTFEEELSDNLSMIGFDNKQSNEISQAISFGICEKAPLVISENAKLIAQCLSAVLNGGTVSELFVPPQGISIEELSATISDCLITDIPIICLIHGIFDSYTINLFNALYNIMQNWKNVIILLSSEGMPSKMIMPGVWNRAIYIDGDSGFERKSFDALHSFTGVDNLDFRSKTIDTKSKDYKETKRIFKLFTKILSNTQIGMYSRYLSVYNSSLNDSNLILTQLIITALSMGDTEYLKDLFHENGIENGERYLTEIIKG